MVLLSEWGMEQFEEKYDLTLGLFSKNVTLRIETVLHLVLKFQVDRARFHGEEEEMQRWESGITGRRKRIQHLQ